MLDAAPSDRGVDEDDDAVENRDEAARRRLAELRAANDARWQRLQSLLLRQNSGGNDGIGGGDSRDAPEDGLGPPVPPASVSDRLRFAGGFLESPKAGSGRRALAELQARVRAAAEATASTQTLMPEDLRGEADRELLRTYEALTEAADYLEAELQRERDRLRERRLQRTELQELQDRLVRAEQEQAEQAKTASAASDPSTASQAMDRRNRELREELAVVAAALQAQVLEPPSGAAPAPNDRFLWWKEPVAAPAPQPEAEPPPPEPRLAFPDLLLALVDRLAAHERDEEYYLQLATPATPAAPDNSHKDITTGTEDPRNDVNYDPLHVRFLLEQDIMEAFAEDPRLVRLLPEYKHT